MITIKDFNDLIEEYVEILIDKYIDKPDLFDYVTKLLQLKSTQNPNLSIKELNVIVDPTNAKLLSFALEFKYNVNVYLEYIKNKHTFRCRFTTNQSWINESQELKTKIDCLVVAWSNFYVAKISFLLLFFETVITMNEVLQILPEETLKQILPSDKDGQLCTQ